MASSYTSLLGLVLPVQGELSGVWGDTVNNELTSLLDTAIAGTTTLNTDADVTLSTTTGAANQARQQIILWTANGTVTRNITAPAQSKSYIVINATGSTQSIVLRGAGPTTGVTVLAGEKAVVAWNGSDFVKVSTFGGSPSFTNVTVTGTTSLSGLTASTALALNASKEVVSVTNTGTGNNVLATSPTLTTPNLGTPSALTLTNATGLPLSTGVTGTLATTNGGTGLTSFTANGVVYASSTSALTSGSALTFDGTNLTQVAGTPVFTVFETASGNNNRLILTQNSGLTTYNLTYSSATTNAHVFQIGGGEQMRLTSTGLGIGTSSPVSKLNVDGTTAISWAGGGISLGLVTLGTQGTGGSLFVNTPSLNSSFASGLGVDGSYSGGASTVNIKAYGVNSGGPYGSNLAFFTSSTTSLTEKMRLDSSGNLGIGTSSPGYKLDVESSAGSLARFTRGSISISAFLGTAEAFWGTDTNTPLVFTTNATEKMRLDSSGNLGLGGTPSASWSNSWSALQIGVSAAVWAFKSVNGLSGSYLSNNSVFNGTNRVYINTAAAAEYAQVTGQHIWYTAPSGTAGNAITFTQAMTLDASGNLGVGVTSISGFRADILSTSTDAAVRARTSNNNEVLRVESAGTATSSIRFINTSVNNTYISADGTALSFLTGGSERARITSGGDLLVGTTSSTQNADIGLKFLPGGAVYVVNNGGTDGFSYYNTTAGAYRFYVQANGTIAATNTTIAAISDQRLKENIQDLDVGLDKIMALKPRKFDWKAGKGKDIKGDRGFIAQEFEQVFPDLIDEWKDPAPEGEEPYKSVRQDLIPVLVKAIQEQQALITDLRARVAALEA